MIENNLNSEKYFKASFMDEKNNQIDVRITLGEKIVINVSIADQEELTIRAFDDSFQMSIKKEDNTENYFFVQLNEKEKEIVHYSYYEIKDHIEIESFNSQLIFNEILSTTRIKCYLNGNKLIFESVKDAMLEHEKGMTHFNEIRQLLNNLIPLPAEEKDVFSYVLNHSLTTSENILYTLLPIIESKSLEESQRKRSYI